MLNAWSPEETEVLTGLYRAKRELSGAAGFAYGETDRHDPQFYVLGGDEAKPCKTCVSRLVRNGRCWYVIEDGEGVIQAEGDNLRQLIKRVCGLRHSARYSLTAVLALTGQQWTNDGVFLENLATIVNCVPAIG
jgi:hypothetical protein